MGNLNKFYREELNIQTIITLSLTQNEAHFRLAPCLTHLPGSNVSICLT